MSHMLTRDADARSWCSSLTVSRPVSPVRQFLVSWVVDGPSPVPNHDSDVAFALLLTRPIAVP